MTEETAREARPGLERGLVSVFTGSGKGKTSAAVGTAVRAVGHGLKVYMLFFMKGQTYEHGEFKVLESLPGVTLKSVGKKGWIRGGEVSQELKDAAVNALTEVRKAMRSGQYDLFVLDEANTAVHKGLLELDDLTSLIEQKPQQVELIITGRYADPALVRMADLVSEILMIKHPFSEGVTARRGIDY